MLIQLVGPRAHLNAVGDDSQCIYAWRGARPEIMGPDTGIEVLRTTSAGDQAAGRAAACYPDERDRIRLPIRLELLVRFVCANQENPLRFRPTCV